MPKLVNELPKYRKHRASGQAVVTIAGRMHYLGPMGSKASRVQYDRIILEYLASGRRGTAEQTTPAAFTVAMTVPSSALVFESVNV